MNDMSDTTTAEVFSAPSEELVLHATRELEYAERLTVHKMTSGVGNTTTDVYAFPQLVNILFATPWGNLLKDGSKGELIWIDPPRLVAWIADVLGDREFADALSAALEGPDHYKAQMDAMTPLFRERVAQYQDVLRAIEARESAAREAAEGGAES